MENMKAKNLNRSRRQPPVITKATLLVLPLNPRRKMLSNHTTKLSTMAATIPIASKPLVSASALNTPSSNPLQKARMECCPFCPANVEPTTKQDHISADHANLCFKCKKCMNKHFRGSYGPLFTTYQELREHYRESHGRPLGEELGEDDGQSPDSAHTLECSLCDRPFLCQSTRPLSLHLRHDHTDEAGKAPHAKSALAQFARMSCRMCDFSTKEVGAWMSHFTRASMGRTFCLKDKMSAKAHQEATKESSANDKGLDQKRAVSRSQSSSSDSSSSRSRSRSSSSRSTRSRSPRSCSSRSSSSRCGRRRRRSRSSSASLDSCRTHETVYDYGRGVTVKRKIFGFARQPSKRRWRRRRARTRSRSSSISRDRRRNYRQEEPQLGSSDVKLSGEAGFLLKVKEARKKLSPVGQRDFK